MNKAALTRLRCGKQLAISQERRTSFEEPGTLDRVAQLAREVVPTPPQPSRARCHRGREPTRLTMKSMRPRIDCFLVWCQEVDQQRRQTCIVEEVRYVAVARAVPAVAFVRLHRKGEGFRNLARFPFRRGFDGS